MTKGELHLLICAMERAAFDNEQVANQLLKAHDYSAELPAADAETLRKGIEWLRRDGLGLL